MADGRAASPEATDADALLERAGELALIDEAATTINGCQCCPDASAPTGYTYCSSLSNYCCNPAGGCRVCGS